MDIFVRNIPPQATERQLRDFFRAQFEPLRIHTFNFQKFRNKGQGIATVCDVAAGAEFLRLHGSSGKQRPIIQLKFLGGNIYCCAGNKAPDPFLLKYLKKQHIERIKAKTTATSKTVASSQSDDARRFKFHTLWNGQWEYRDTKLIFQPTYIDSRGGSIGLGDNCFVVLIDATSTNLAKIRLDIPYHSIDSVVTGGSKTKSITLTLTQAPLITEIGSQNLISSIRSAEYPVDGTMSAAFLAMMVSRLSVSAPPKITRRRLHQIDPLHEQPGICLVYCIEISSTDLRKLERSIQAFSSIPNATNLPITIHSQVKQITSELQSLIESLRDMSQFGTLPFPIKFQIQRLSQNGFLSPRTVAGLLPDIKLLLQEFDIVAISEALRKLLNTSEYLGPQNDYSYFTHEALVQTIREYCASFVNSGSIYAIASRHEYLGVIHRVTITPCGTYLDGPDLETKNRVLRLYPQHADYFIRVTFADEDGERVHQDQHIDRNLIFRDRFRQKLENGINIAGRIYAFLGFSHSSLRSQQCWFMAPFVYDGQLRHAQVVIKSLGDFSSFRSPAKCAARIGQAFSDATETIPMPEESIRTIPDIERNDRVFSDGVGCISKKLLQKVWSNSSRTRKLHPTVLQIRFKGAKGMLALNPVLEGEQLCLRPSMTKFGGSESLNLEICGAGFRPLQTYLNRQFIKILEDLDVPPQNFLSLQNEAVETLRTMTTSALNAAIFMDLNRICSGSRTSDLIRRLDDLGLDFHDDSFLRRVTEIAALVRLRDIKHRGRIPVEKAFKLYGIVDETGYLQEGEIHAVIRNDQRQRKVLVRDRVVVTRAPALHPGDIQLARAVDIPADSPNMKLHNCVIFSQHGQRDLPSQLSGGDLDGDTFDIIYDSRLFPKKIAKPADYSRPTPIDIQRPVVTSDICDFFITFMQNDQLGHVCNSHVQVADQKASGTLDQSCIILAEMASTAVDFSKTGIPVDMGNMPTDFARRLKPDFMANGPRLILGQNLVQKNDELHPEFEDYDADEVNAINPAPSRVMYYESEKILGRLYRAIDEKKFLDEMQAHHRQENAGNRDKPSVIRITWDYVQRETHLVEWHQHKHIARDIREFYELELVNIMDRYSPHPRYMLTELEVFSGTILGKDGSLPNKRIRDTNEDMKDRFNRGVSATIAWIERGVIGDEEDADDDESIQGASEGLARSIACFHLAMTEEGTALRRSRQSEHAKEIMSFVYVAAAVCLRELERFQGLGYLRPL